MPDWLASKFGSEYIAKIKEYADESDFSNYKFQFEKTDEFYAKLKRILHNIKDTEQFNELAKCVPEIALLEEEIMAGESHESLFNIMREHLDNFGSNLLFLSKNFDRKSNLF